MRLTQLTSWIKSWAPDCMYAGVQGKGAEDGWYATAVALEPATATGRHYTAGAVDIMKCFDQLQRPLIYELARKAGMPEAVVATYEAYQENMKAMNSLAGGLGKPYRKPASIPQSCPLSMALIGLLMTPWIRMMEAGQEQPRVLADDIFLLAVGDGHAARFERSFDITHRYIADMGSRMEPKKSLILSSCSDTREAMRSKKWIMRRRLSEPS